MTRKVHSSEEPNWYFLDKIVPKGEGPKPYLVLRIHWNIKEVKVTEPEPHTIWEYDEEVLEHTPKDIINVDEVVSYIEAHKKWLIKEAQNKRTTTEVVASNIETIRKEPVLPNWKQKLFEEDELYFGVISEIDDTKSDKRYIKVKHLEQHIYIWCHVTSSIMRAHKEGKLKVGDYVIVGFVGGKNYPVVLDSVIT